MTWLALVLALISPGAKSERAWPTNPPVCVQYFHAACSQALGVWLPTFGFGSAFWDGATRIRERDGFIYEGEHPRSPDFLGFQGPDDGTSFSYGDAGPPKGHVVYDYARGIAFYEQGCCSWNEVVEAYASVPPKTVVNRDLRALKTVRGISLGMSPQGVRRIYGPAKPQRVPLNSGVYVLSYTTWPPRRQITIVRGPCGQFQNFYFQQERLVLIQLANGC